MKNLNSNEINTVSGGLVYTVCDIKKGNDILFQLSATKDAIDHKILDDQLQLDIFNEVVSLLKARDISVNNTTYPVVCRKIIDQFV